MRSFRGIGLLLIANILIFVTLSITFTVLVNFVLPAFGIDLRGAILQQDLLWAFVIGFLLCGPSLAPPVWGGRR